MKEKTFPDTTKVAKKRHETNDNSTEENPNSLAMKFVVVTVRYSTENDLFLPLSEKSR